MDRKSEAERMEGQVCVGLGKLPLYTLEGLPTLFGNIKIKFHASDPSQKDPV